MESPLDVLSRAATIQLNNMNGDLKRSLELNSPTRELPSKMLKYKRMKERQQMLAAAAEADSDVDRKCAGTQTYNTCSFDRHSPEPHRPHSEPNTSYRILDLDTRHTMSSAPGGGGGGTAGLPPPAFNAPHHLITAPQRVPSPAHMAGAPTPRSRGSPAPAHEHERMDTDSHPLNLSVTSSSHNSRSPPTSSRHHVTSMTSSSDQSRPSVITIAPTTTLTNHNNNRVGSGYSGYPHYSFLSQSSANDIRTASHTSQHRREQQQQDDVCDPAIEEHFRRSLGAHYPNFMTKDITTHATESSPMMTSHPPVTSQHVASPSPKSASASPPPPVTSRVPSSSVSPSSLSPRSGHWSSPSPPNSSSASHSHSSAPSRGAESEKAVSVTGTVDDHFARALGGDTWNQIKSQKEVVNMDIYTGSVDDHFAKALGDTWYKIKAEKEGSRSPERSPRSSHSSSPVSRPRSSSRSPSLQTSGHHS